VFTFKAPVMALHSEGSLQALSSTEEVESKLIKTHSKPADMQPNHQAEARIPYSMPELLHCLLVEGTITTAKVTMPQKSREQRKT
jgi:hypothetical protein